jgi:hypothetical protein
MRTTGRFIPRDAILRAADAPVIVEVYPDDKYLPGYLVLGRYGGDTFHLVVAVDVLGGNIRIVTASRPGVVEWCGDMKTRRPKP